MESTSDYDDIIYNDENVNNFNKHVQLQYNQFMKNVINNDKLNYDDKKSKIVSKLGLVRDYKWRFETKLQVYSKKMERLRAKLIQEQTSLFKQSNGSSKLVPKLTSMEILRAKRDLVTTDYYYRVFRAEIGILSRVERRLVNIQMQEYSKYMTNKRNSTSVKGHFRRSRGSFLFHTGLVIYLVFTIVFIRGLCFHSKLFRSHY